jgi:N-sulfoglucosamine sulfohydrolase
MILRLVLSSLLLSLTASAAEKPNILFLLSDDHSYPYLGCYGSTNVKTPTLDQLAAEGMKFHRFFTGSPQCVPSRATLMTGRSPVAARITRFSSPLPADETTLPEVLRDLGGYHTGICGRSYHLDGSGERSGPEVAKFIEEQGMKTFHKRVHYLKPGGDPTVVGMIEEFITQVPDGKPFFMWANFSDPHHVWTPPAELRPDPATLTLPAHFPDTDGARQQLADYCGEVNRLDGEIARILQMLEKRGLKENTIVVFCGDNGMAMPHGKGSLYDPGCNTPFIVRWPGKVKPQGDSKALISGEDLAPTMIAAAGLEVPQRMTGVSFLPLLLGQQHQPRQHLFMERGPHGSAAVQVNMTNSSYDLARAVRSDRYKFIYNCTPWLPYSPVDSASGALWKSIQQLHESGSLSPALAATYFTTPRPVYELYDLEADPSELNNLSGKAELAQVERELRIALTKKMIQDFDYLPLPDIPASNEAKKGKGAKGANAEQSRAQSFKRFDTDKNGTLSKEEFIRSRGKADGESWFERRDADHDGVISREEYLPNSPLGDK